MNDWHNVKNILCIRPDNMGDLIMSGPAIRALKESFGAKITVLTSAVAALIVKSMPEIDETIIFDVPWVKTNTFINENGVAALIENLQSRNFDATIIFTVYSQNPIPSAMIAYLANIPRILAYCRENPYGLITHWVPDKEPYDLIKHQVKRDLDLVRTIGATPLSEKLQLAVNYQLWPGIQTKLTEIGIKTNKPWLILHPGVSEKKRYYPFEKWIEAAKMVIAELGYQLLISGSETERSFALKLQSSIGAGSFAVAGLLPLNEFICLVAKAEVMLSVNTGAVHIAAATVTPVVVLYAQTNPQHTPWQAPHEVLEFSIGHELQSKNEVITYVNKKLYATYKPLPNAAEIIKSINNLKGQPKSSFQPFHGHIEPVKSVM